MAGSLSHVIYRAPPLAGRYRIRSRPRDGGMPSIRNRPARRSRSSSGAKPEHRHPCGQIPESRRKPGRHFALDLQPESRHHLQAAGRSVNATPPDLTTNNCKEQSTMASVGYTTFAPSRARSSAIPTDDGPGASKAPAIRTCSALGVVFDPARAGRPKPAGWNVFPTGFFHRTAGVPPAPRAGGTPAVLGTSMVLGRGWP